MDMTSGMLELWLIRHGETPGNKHGIIQGQTDAPLNELGLSQARKLAPRLAHEQFDGVYASDLQRAHNTAKLALPNAEIKLDQRIREISFGRFENIPWDDLTDEDAAMIQARRKEIDTYQLPGAESNVDVRVRIADFLKDLPEQGKFAIFCHGGVIRNTLLWVMNMAMPNPDDWGFTIDNTSITILRRTNGRMRIVRVNDIHHLDD
ncbi:MAG: histidine phosphatase family protein [Deinococcota bacterium]